MAERASEALTSAMGVPRFGTAVVLGSGWADAAAAVGTPKQTISVASLPGFAKPRVPGHGEHVSHVEVAGHAVLVFSGRLHLYEGYSPSEVVHGVRAAVMAGCRQIILTNAAGSLRAEWPVSEIVLIRDQLNLTGCTPLSGAQPPRGYPVRFADLTTAYSARMRSVVRSIAPSMGEGVYAGVLGGAYETPAEVMMLRGFGADLVGMSTALETIAAVHLGSEVLGLSLVTNLAAGLSPNAISHDGVLAVGRDMSPRLGELLRATLEQLEPATRPDG